MDVFLLQNRIGCVLLGWNWIWIAGRNDPTILRIKLYTVREQVEKSIVHIYLSLLCISMIGIQ